MGKIPVEKPVWPSDIRLVDDRSVTYGRLQMLYHAKWRGICANSIKWVYTSFINSVRSLYK